MRLMLVDDEPPARRAMRRLLGAHGDVEIVAEAGTVAEAARAAQASDPDLILLDIGLTDGEGFDLLAALPGSAAIVFVTAHSAFAARAFDVAAVDYLLKPVDPARLATALERVRHRLSAGEKRRDNGARPAVDLEHRLALTANGTTSLVPVASVAFLTAEADFTRLHLVDGRQSLVCRLLKLFEEELPVPPFLRVSRSVILNLDHVARLERTADGGATVSLAGGTVDLGRIPARRLLASLKEAPRGGPEAVSSSRAAGSQIGG